jgi:dTDP-4-amino-4,6-dideoxygalactose transaminase
MDTKLALFGGSPVRKKFLPLHKPSIGKEEEKEIISTLRSGWLTKGPKTKKFERMFAKFCKVKRAVGLNSCTAALHLSLLGLGIKKGDEVITTPLTFAATVNMIVNVGARPVFVDVEPQTLNMDVTQIEEKITSRTKAILPVHFIGQPCEMDVIQEIAEKHGMSVINDAAHAIETEYKGKKIGALGTCSAFSFYATKNITTGEGGMLTTNDDELADKVEILSLHGMTKGAWERYKKPMHWEILFPGYNYVMWDVQASLGIHQLKKIGKFWKKRKKLVELYNEELQNIPEVEPLRQEPKKQCKNAYHLYVVILKTEKLRANREQIMKALLAENIGVGIHYRAVHLHPYYKQNFKVPPLPVAEYASERVLTLPLFPRMNEEDVMDVVEAVKKVVSYYRKRSR